ncbi:MAG: thiamine pyrophosphate-dependent enzyme, partial [Synechococcus sp.]|nr:thiamine pyrophosphate-dependent enzyme [Synechococcus sp.]
KAFWAERDPIKAFHAEMLNRGVLSADDMAAIDQEIDAEVREAVEFALAAPEPDPSELTRYIWAED